MNKIEGKITPIKDKILISNMNFGDEVLSSGIIIKSDDGKADGVKPRWGQVWAIGPEQTDVKVGEWVLVEHGQWTRGITVNDYDGTEITIRGINNNAILLVSDNI